MTNIGLRKRTFILIGIIFGFTCFLFANSLENPQTSIQSNLKTPKSSHITDTMNNVSDHVWSTDETMIAYIKCIWAQDWNCELWVADVSGGSLTNHKLISSEAEAYGLEDWKDDWILFRIKRESGTPSEYYGRNELWKIKSDGTGLTQVTFTETNGIKTMFNAFYNNRGTVRGGKFIPGTNLVYFNAHDGNGWYQMYACDDDGTDSWYTISNPDYAWTWGISPTGNKVLWGQMDDYFLPSTFKASDVDGSNWITIKACSAVTYPLVLADGNTVVWHENNNLYAIDMDGTNERTVIDDEDKYQCYNYNPAEIQGFIMGSNRSDGLMHIFKLDSYGTDIVQLTDGLYNDESPIFSPNGQYLSYLRLPFDFDKGSNPVPYPCELVITRGGISAGGLPGIDFNIYILIGILSALGIVSITLLRFQHKEKKGNDNQSVIR